MVATELVKESIWDSAKETFETMIFLPIENGVENAEPIDSASLMGTITYTGQIQGAFSILCRSESAEKIARAMLMMEPEEEISESDICDAFGELTNLVIGGIKARLNEIAPDIQISIPSVTQGLQIQPVLNHSMTRTDVNAKTDGQPLQMTMIYKAAG